MASGFSSDRRGQVAATAPRFTADAIVAAAILVGALYVGRDVFVPIVLSILLSFVLAGPARLLQGWGVPRIGAIGGVVTLAFLLILGIGMVLTSQLTTLAGDLPRYQSTIREKLESVRGAAGGNATLSRVTAMLEDLGRSSSTTPSAAPAGGAALEPGARTATPVPVEIQEKGATGLERIAAVVSPLLHPLATMGLVAVFVIFILVQQVDLRNRAIRLAGSHDLQRTTAAMNDAARRLSRYFLTQVLLNTGFGVVAGLGLWMIGVPSPILWGILAGISRFVPYLGVFLAAGGPLILAGAVDPGWTMLLAAAGLFLTIELLVGQVVEPLLYGHSTGLTPVAVIVSVTFWTWLWGGVGLLLATPLTVCLVVLGRHVEALAFLDVMFGDRPPLTAAESFYQRMLAGDPNEAYGQAEDFLRDHALVSYYDEVAIRGLALAQIDAARGALAEERLERVEAAITELVDDLADVEDVAPRPDAPRGGPQRAEGDADLDGSLARSDALAAELALLGPAGSGPPLAGPPVLCVAGRNGLDRACALILAQLLEKHGVAARVEPASHLARRGAHDAEPTGLVVLSFLDVTSPVRIRYAVRRMRRLQPGATIMVGAWGAEASASAELCRAAHADHCVDRLGEGVRVCLDVLRGPASGSDQETAAGGPAPRDGGSPSPVAA